MPSEAIPRRLLSVLAMSVCGGVNRAYVMIEGRGEIVDHQRLVSISQPSVLLVLSPNDACGQLILMSPIQYCLSDHCIIQSQCWHMHFSVPVFPSTPVPCCVFAFNANALSSSLCEWTLIIISLKDQANHKDVGYIEDMVKE